MYEQGYTVAESIDNSLDDAFNDVDTGRVKVGYNLLGKFNLNIPWVIGIWPQLPYRHHFYPDDIAERVPCTRLGFARPESKKEIM